MLLLTDAPRTEETLPERRRGLRIRQNRPVKIYEPAAARYFGGQTHDISSSGLRLELPVSTPIRPGRVVSIHVGSEHGESLANQRQMHSARVIWLDRENSTSRGRMLVGIQFLAAIAAQANVA